MININIIIIIMIIIIIVDTYIKGCTSVFIGAVGDDMLEI